MLDVELEEVRQRLLYETPFWAEHCAKIIPKNRSLGPVPLVARPWQLDLDAKLEQQRAAGLPMRAIILKARKLGFSTWVQAKMSQRVMGLPYQYAIAVAQDRKTAGVLADMVVTIHRNLPDDVQLHRMLLGENAVGPAPFSIKPFVIGQSQTRNGQRFLSFSFEASKQMREMGAGGESVYEVDTAENESSGRGYTPSMVHGSEVAHWPDNGKLLGLLNAVPREPETLIVLESTANGFNHFQRRWVLAREGAEDPEAGTSYVPIFAAWWQDPDCQRVFASLEARERFVESIGKGPYGEDEPMLQEVYGCTPEQLYWRRTVIREDTDNSIERFKQEFPASEEEAFIGSGVPVFSGILVARAIEQAKATPEPVQGTLRGADFKTRRTRSATIEVPQRAIWVPEELAAAKHLIRVWEHPRTAEAEEQRPKEERRSPGQYVVAADVSESVENTFGDDTDFHAVQVLDHVERWQVAEYQSRVATDEFAELLVLLATYYNGAWLAIEANGPGLAVLDRVRQDFKYPRLYRRKRIDTVRNVTEDRPGWKTDKQTKPAMEMTALDALKAENHGGVRSQRLGRQLTTYVEHKTPSGRVEHGAMPGEHDDLVDAWMIAHRVADTVRPRSDEPPKRSVRGFTVRDPLTGF